MPRWEVCKHGLGYVKCTGEVLYKCLLPSFGFSVDWRGGGVKIFACGLFPGEKQAA